MTTGADLCYETLRYLMPAQQDLSASLVSAITATSATVTLSGPMATQNTVSYGMQLSVDLEIMYVKQWTATSKTASVIRGYMGSTAAPHAATAQVFINPKFPLFSVFRAINEELAGLSGEPELYRMRTVSITYNPVFQGYDFPAEGNWYEVAGIRFRIAPPTHNLPPIRSWAAMKTVPTSIYPSGNCIIIYESGWPGLPIFVWYKTQFTTLTSLTQTVQSTTGLPSSANDIVPMGAAARLVLGREIKRNFFESQPDPRKAQDVPPGAVINSVKGLQILYIQRRDEEAAKLRRTWQWLKVR